MASLLALMTVAVAQPLLDLLGRNAAFLVAHDATRIDVVGLALMLTIAVPLLLALLVLVVKRLSPTAAAVVHSSVLVVLGALLVLVVLQRSGLNARLPGAHAIVVAVLVATAVPVAYRHSEGVRRFALVLALTAPAVAALFVFASPAKALVFPEPAAGAIEGLEDPPTIVMVLFDELPLASLLKSDGEIDAENFPAFGRVAGDATWFRNTTTVHGQTSDVVPAALSGIYPDPTKLPIASDHPGNLFALLGGEYRMHVQEPLTQLCPPGHCPRQGGADPQRLWNLMADLAVVGSHLVLPPDLAGSLPPVDQGWKDFRTAAAAEGKEVIIRDRFRASRETNPTYIFEDFIEETARSKRPTVHYLHILLPHSPWRYARDGREYDATTQRPGIEYGRWVNDPWNVAQGYQRHLVQLQLADRLLGELLDKLEAQGMYDDSAVVVFADHGGSFTPNTSQRVIEQVTIPEIAYVPFFVKPPGQTTGTVSDRPLETVDVLPTVLDVIGVEPPAGIDGMSALDPDAPTRTVKRFFGPNGSFEFEPTLDTVWPIVERKERIFGASDDVPFPYGMAPRSAGALLGTQAPDDVDPAEGVTATIENADAYRDVDNSLPTVPAMISGVLSGATSHRPAVAVGVNGRVEAIALTDLPEPDAGRRFRALVPPPSLRDGANTIEIFLVDDLGELVPVPLVRSASDG